MKVELSKEELEILSAGLWHYELNCLDENISSVMKTHVKFIRKLNNRIIKLLKRGKIK